jgi:FMN-dependent NADH-azoreductase
MTTLLHMDASAQALPRSLSRQLGAQFIDEWKKRRPQDRVIRRDVAEAAIPPVTSSWIAAAFTPPEQRTAAMRAALALSDTLVEEVTAADVIVMGVPMYNYGMPAAMKAWIDQIARIGCTFSFDLARGDVPIEPILHGKTLVVLSSRGEFGFQPGGMRQHMNLLDPHIAACAHYFGVAREDIHTVAIEYQEFKDDRHERSKAECGARVTTLVARLAANVK